MWQLTTKKRVQRYFQENKKKLEDWYPGVNEKRLMDEVYKYLCLWRGVDAIDLEDQSYPYDELLELFFEKLSLGVPLQYITHKAHFYGCELFVSPHVLIPRSETEILVEETLKELNSKKEKEKLSFLEIGIGSGAIFLTILRNYRGNSHIDLYLSDISQEALNVSRRNYFLQGLGLYPKHSLKWYLGDRFQKIKESVFDFIVTNPPYIKAKSDLSQVHPQVLQYEPAQALFLSDQTYEEWFEDFFLEAAKRLNKDGVFIMEGHEKHLDQLKPLAEKSGLCKVEIIPDLTGRKRFLKARKNG